MVTPPITFLIGAVAWIASIALGIAGIVYAFLHDKPTAPVVCVPLSVGLIAALLTSWRSPEPLITALFALLAPLLLACASLAVICLRRRHRSHDRN